MSKNEKIMRKNEKYLERRCNHLEYLVDRLTARIIQREKEVSNTKRELHISNAHIVDLQKDVDGKSDSSTPHQNFKDINCTTFIASDGMHFRTPEEAIEHNKRLDTYMFNKKEVVDDGTNFSSRFMPNVKFTGERSTEIFLDSFEPINWGLASKGYIGGFMTSLCGAAIYSLTDEDYEASKLKEVSIYEAIPELIPEGMYYSGEKGELCAFACGGYIDKIKANTKEQTEELCEDLIDYEALQKSMDDITKSFFENIINFGFAGTTYGDIEISDFSKNLATTKPFNCSQVQWVVNIFGESKCEKILDMITVCGFDLSDVEPLKK